MDTCYVLILDAFRDGMTSPMQMANAIDEALAKVPDVVTWGFPQTAGEAAAAQRLRDTFQVTPVEGQ